MKTHFKILAAALAAALIGGCMPALAAVQLRWNVETSRAQPASFDVYRGETLHLAADMTSYGRPIEMAGAAALYIQTNGMADVWWTIPATVATNRIEATLSPTNYPGDAQVLNCYLGGPATSYRAAFRLRVLGAPGPAPNALALPARSIDFSQVEVANAPWIPTAGGVADDLRVTGTLYFGEPPTPGVLGFGSQYITPGGGGLKMRYPDGRSVLILNEGNFGDYLYGTIGEDLEWMYETVEGLQTDAEQIMPLAQAVTNLSNTVNAWQTYWDGDDVRLTVTNYYGSADLPRLYLEQKVADGGTNYFRRVWDETTRHGAILSRVAALETNVAEKADRAWGFYDSHTGGYAPDGCTSISSPNVIVAGGMAYQRTVTTAGAVWVLTANDPTLVGGTSAGYFRISDDDGNALFEIAKGDRRTVGATATGLAMEGGSMVVTYAVQADEHPTIYLAESLTNTTWQAEESSSLASVSWTGASGAWTALVTPSAARLSLFVKATYEVGGKTYIKHAAPISVEGGILCTDGIHKVRPVYSNGTITWQVVQ